jgi:mannose-6-phosphate isomerase-like protein (cupin superfamily)
MQVIRRDEDLAWLDWGQGAAAVPRYKTFFSAEDTRTTGLLQGTLVYPPGTRVVPHWHTPVETYFVLSGSGAAHIGPDTFRLSPGTAVYVASRVIHWFENDTDADLTVFWTLACDAMADLDFTPAG